MVPIFSYLVADTNFLELMLIVKSVNLILFVASPHKKTIVYKANSNEGLVPIKVEHVFLV